MASLLCLFSNIHQLTLVSIVLYDNLILVRQLLDLDHQLEGVNDIQQEDSVEESDKEGERQVSRQPVQRIHNLRMKHQIIKRCKRIPETGEQRTYNALDIPPIGRIIP